MPIATCSCPRSIFILAPNTSMPPKAMAAPPIKRSILFMDLAEAFSTHWRENPLRTLAKAMMAIAIPRTWTPVLECLAVNLRNRCKWTFIFSMYQIFFTRPPTLARYAGPDGTGCQTPNYDASGICWPPNNNNNMFLYWRGQ